MGMFFFLFFFFLSFLSFFFFFFFVFFLFFFLISVRMMHLFLLVAALLFTPRESDVYSDKGSVL